MAQNANIFGQRLALLRKEKAYSMAELAKLIGCSSSLISDYENGKKEPGLTNILKLSQVLGESTDYLCGTTEYRKLKKIAE